MRLCFIVEEKYRHDGMPLDVARRLREWGHEVELLEPDRVLTAVSELASRRGQLDAFVLKTVSNGPGLSLLAAASASGYVAVNKPAAIRLVRDKAVAAAVCRLHGIPFPVTFFASRAGLLREVPAELYPIVVKPAHGSSNEGVHLVTGPGELDASEPGHGSEGFLLAQPYTENLGRDLKVYCCGGEIFATVQPSPLHPDRGEVARLIPAEPGLRRLAERVGRIFGLSVYGLDVVESPDGWVVVDVNDFPSFRLVPDAAALVGETILRLAAGRRRSARTRPRASPLTAPVPVGVTSP
jgi:glutathione synthase/RimK-type ligase-like ATP-grasp enzyme